MPKRQSSPGERLRATRLALGLTLRDVHGKPQIGAEASEQEIHFARKPAARFRGEEYNPQPSPAVHSRACLPLRSERTVGLVRRSTPLNA